MITPARGRLRVAAMATVLALVVGMIAALAAASPAAASPPGAVVASIYLPRDSYDLESGLGAMWALSNDDFHTFYSTLYRIDPGTNRVTERVHLGFPAPFLTTGYGSVWVTDYYASKLYRLSPAGQVRATIPTGLQPQWLHIAFGSVWVSNHTRALGDPLDPLTNGVIATVQVGARQFRSGPQDLTDNGHYLYVESSDLPYLQRIDPATDTVRNLTPTGLDYGSELRWVSGPAGGTLWNIAFPGAQADVYGYDILGTIRLRIRPAAGTTLALHALAYLDDVIWYAENTRGHPDSATLRGVDRVTGALVQTIPVIGQVSTLHAGFWHLWAVDPITGIVQRIHPGPARIDRSST